MIEIFVNKNRSKLRIITLGKIKCLQEYKLEKQEINTGKYKLINIREEMTINKWKKIN